MCSTWNQEQTIFKWISKHFSAFWWCEHTLMHIQTCCARLFSLPNRNAERRGVSEPLHSSREPRGACVGAGLWRALPEHLLEPQSLSHGLPLYKTVWSLKQWLWSVQKRKSSITHHFTGQPYKFMGNCQVAMSPGHERDPSWKQPVVSVSGRCAQGTWVEVNPSGNQVQICLLMGSKEAVARSSEFGVLTET